MSVLADLAHRVDRLVGDDKPRERSNVRLVMPSNGRGAGVPRRHRVGDPEVHEYDAKTGACEFPGCEEIHGTAEDHLRARSQPGVDDDDDVGDAPPDADEGLES